jgi:hypothetical protein
MSSQLENLWVYRNQAQLEGPLGSHWLGTHVDCLRSNGTSSATECVGYVSSETNVGLDPDVTCRE